MAACLSSKYEKGVDASRCPSVIVLVSLIFLSVPSWAFAAPATSRAHTVATPTETRLLRVTIRCPPLRVFRFSKSGEKAGYFRNQRAVSKGPNIDQVGLRAGARAARPDRRRCRSIGYLMAPAVRPET